MDSYIAWPYQIADHYCRITWVYIFVILTISSPAVGSSRCTPIHLITPVLTIPSCSTSTIDPTVNSMSSPGKSRFANLDFHNCGRVAPLGPDPPNLTFLTWLNCRFSFLNPCLVSRNSSSGYKNNKIQAIK